MRHEPCANSHDLEYQQVPSQMSAWQGRGTGTDSCKWAGGFSQQTHSNFLLMLLYSTCQSNQCLWGEGWGGWEQSGRPVI